MFIIKVKQIIIRDTHKNRYVIVAYYDLFRDDMYQSELQEIENRQGNIVHHYLVVIALTQYAIRFGIIYPFLQQAELDLYLSEGIFAALVLATVLIAAAGYIINDYFDIKLDYLNKPRQMIVGKSISRRYAMFWHIVLNAIGLSLAGYVAYTIGHPMLILFQLVSAALLWFYSVSFKKQVFIGNLIIASLTALVPFTAGYYEVAGMFDYLPELTGEPEGDQLIENLGSLLFSSKYLL